MRLQRVSDSVRVGQFGQSNALVRRTQRRGTRGQCKSSIVVIAGDDAGTDRYSTPAGMRLIQPVRF
jgi:hypothetical protein